MERIPDKNRPQYTPSARFRALRAGRVLKLSPAELATLLSVSVGTVFRWQGEMSRADDDTRTIGRTVRPSPPLTRYADVVEHLAQALAFAGLSGQRMIASTLARAEYLVSRSTVRRRLRKPASVPPEPAPRAKPRLPRVVKAKHPNNVWMAELTLVRSLFGLQTFHVAVILDVFSRLPLVAQVYAKAPSSADMAPSSARPSAPSDPRLTSSPTAACSSPGEHSRGPWSAAASDTASALWDATVPSPSSSGFMLSS